MSNAVATINPNLPAAIRNLLAKQGSEVMQEVTGGVTSGFPIISYRGKAWRIRKGGEETNVVNDEGDPVPAIEVVLIKSNPMPSKIYYEKEYEEGATDSPICWSADGMKPDPGVQKPVCKTCAACPNNAWGSKITKQGTKTKACADARRMAVTSRQELEEHGDKAPLYLMRVPPASLNPLKDYAEKVLKPKGIPYFAVVTKVSFDVQASYPKMLFKATRHLTEDEAVAVISLRDSEDARRILAEAAEFDTAGTTDGSEASSSDEEVTPSAPAASTPKKQKPRPVEEEDVGLDDIPAPAPKKKAAPAPVVEEEEEEEEIAPPPPPAKKKKAAAPPPPPVEEEEDEEEIAPPPPPAKKKKAAAPPPPVEDDEDEDVPPPPAKKKAAPKAAAADDFDTMLSSILD